MCGRMCILSQIKEANLAIPTLSKFAQIKHRATNVVVLKESDVPKLYIGLFVKYAKLRLLALWALERFFFVRLSFSRADNVPSMPVLTIPYLHFLVGTQEVR